MRSVEHGVGIGHLGRRFAEVHAPGDVAAVPVHRAAEVAQHDLAVANHARTWVVVRRRRVLAGRNDRKIDDIVPLVDQASRDVGAHRSLGATDERDLAGVQLRVRSLGVGDHFGQSAYSALDLYKKHHLDSGAIVEAAFRNGATHVSLHVEQNEPG